MMKSDLNIRNIAAADVIVIVVVKNLAGLLLASAFHARIKSCAILRVIFVAWSSSAS